MMFRRATIILYVTKQAVLMGVWHGKVYQTHRTYQHQASDYAVFRQTLSQYKTAAIHVIADITEEEYQLSTLPHVTGSERRALLARKLMQFNRNSDYKTVWFIRRERAAREEDVYVLLALLQVDCMQHWMEVLASEQALLATVTTPPLISQDMLRSPHPAQLLCCERLLSGMRLNYVAHGCLHMSRLIPIGVAQAVPLADFYLAEIEKMRLYLLSQKIIRDEDELHISLSGFGAANDVVSAALAQQGLVSHVNHWQGVISKHQLQQLDIDTHPELLYMQWLVNGHQLDNLAPIAMTENYRRWQLTKRLSVVSGFVAAVGLTMSMYFLYQGYVKSEQIPPLVEQTRALSNTYGLIIKDDPKATSNQGVKSAVMMAAQLNQQASSPQRMMKLVSAVLDDEPMIVMNRMRWLQSDEALIKGEEDESLMGNAKQQQARDWLQMAFLNLEIKPFSGDYQLALATANRLVKKLASDTDVASAQLLQAPTNNVSLRKIQGSTREQQLSPLSAAFKLKVVLKPVAEWRRP